MLISFLLKKIQENDICYMSRDLKKKCCLNENLTMTKNIYFGFWPYSWSLCFVLNFVLFSIFVFTVWFHAFSFLRKFTKTSLSYSYFLFCTFWNTSMICFCLLSCSLRDCKIIRRGNFGPGFPLLSLSLVLLIPGDCILVLYYFYRHAFSFLFFSGRELFHSPSWSPFEENSLFVTNRNWAYTQACMHTRAHTYTQKNEPAHIHMDTQQEPVRTLFRKNLEEEDDVKMEHLASRPPNYRVFCPAGVESCCIVI